MHMAKKNLSFELEYIQIVSQSLGDIKASSHFKEFSKKMNDNPLLALSASTAEEEKASSKVKFADES